MLHAVWRTTPCRLAHCTKVQLEPSTWIIRGQHLSKTGSGNLTGLGHRVLPMDSDVMLTERQHALSSIMHKMCHSPIVHTSLMVGAAAQAAQCSTPHCQADTCQLVPSSTCATHSKPPCAAAGVHAVRNCRAIKYSLMRSRRKTSQAVNGYPAQCAGWVC